MNCYIIAQLSDLLIGLLICSNPTLGFKALGKSSPGHGNPGMAPILRLQSCQSQGFGSSLLLQVLLSLPSSSHTTAFGASVRG